MNRFLETVCFPDYINLLVESIYLFFFFLTWGKSVGPRPVKFKYAYHYSSLTPPRGSFQSRSQGELGGGGGVGLSLVSQALPPRLRSSDGNLCPIPVQILVQPIGVVFSEFRAWSHMVPPHTRYFKNEPGSSKHLGLWWLQRH